MKTSIIIALAMASVGCGRAEEASKDSYEKQLDATWSTSCEEGESETHERHVLRLDDGEFTFTTHRFSDEDCEAEVAKFDYQGSYSIGGFVVRKGMSGRTTTMNIDHETASTLTEGEQGPFVAGSTHRAIFLVGGDDDQELTEFDRDGDVIRRYKKD